MLHLFMRHKSTVYNLEEQKQNPISKDGMKSNKDKIKASFGKDKKEGQSEYRVEKTTGRQIITK